MKWNSNTPLTILNHPSNDSTANSESTKKSEEGFLAESGELFHLNSFEYYTCIAARLDSRERREEEGGGSDRSIYRQSIIDLGTHAPTTMSHIYSGQLRRDCCSEGRRRRAEGGRREVGGEGDGDRRGEDGVSC